ncbi:MAG: SIMPL domain-containing protein [Candidatus Sungbacteria bacterium]|nr:SIMPL domain-containing protein [Candidatus Sungbacteria bacterium]
MNENTNGFEKMIGARNASRVVALGSVFLAVLILYFTVSAVKLLKTRPEGELPRQIAVSGEGKTTVKPDIAVFTAGVVAQAAKVKDAQTENTKKSNAIIEFLKKSGVDEKDIKTTEYSIYPQYQSSYPPPCVFPGPCPMTTVRPPEIVSYQVRQTIEVKVRDLGKVDDLLDGVVSAGANEVGSITFKMDDPEAARVAARKEAIDKAKAKAQVLADDLGIRLKRIVSYNEEGSGYPIYPMAMEYAKSSGLGGGAAPAPQVQPGEQEVTANVTIVYEFR